VPAGGYLTAGAIEAGPDGGPRESGGLGRGERAVTVEVTGTAGLEGLVPPALVDVLVSTETAAATGRTLVALAGIELLRLSGSAGAYGTDAPTDQPRAGMGPTALATLRVSLRQAVYLTAADNFAREIRLLARPPGDRSGAGAAVASSDL
jgi:pilus assembly protein CpaB